MSGVVEKLIERISMYEILNNIIPGGVYVVMAERFTTFKFQSKQIWNNLILYYFIGIVIGRIGSIVIESFLFRKEKLEREEYDDYVSAEINDDRVRELSTISNMYRAYTALAICVLFTVIFNFVWILIDKPKYVKPIIIVVGCLVLAYLFGASYIKQTGYVTKRIKAVNDMKSKNNH